jgi:dihydrofolate reductase
MFEIVVACNEKGVIGKDKSIPWDREARTPCVFSNFVFHLFK